jgi:hypothetical protein
MFFFGVFLVRVYVRSLNGLRLDELDCGKLTNAKTDALKEMERLQALAKLNENLKFCN